MTASTEQTFILAQTSIQICSRRKVKLLVEGTRPRWTRSTDGVHDIGIIRAGTDTLARGAITSVHAAKLRLHTLNLDTSAGALAAPTREHFRLIAAKCARQYAHWQN